MDTATSAIARADKSQSKKSIGPSMRGESQTFNMARRKPLVLDTVGSSVGNLNQLLADTLTLRDLYKKHQWQVSGSNVFSMHQLFDKHFEAQSSLVDLLAERVQTLGGVTIAMAQDVAEATLIPRAPKCRENTLTQIARLLQAHGVVLMEAWAMAQDSAAIGDQGTNEIIVNNVIYTNELQAWLLAEQIQWIARIDGAKWFDSCQLAIRPGLSRACR